MKKLLFIGGFPSGGTDLTKTILNAHPQVYINGEMPLLRNLAHYGYDDQTKFTSVTEVERFKEVLKEINVWGNIQNLDHDFQKEFQVKPELTLQQVLELCFSKLERRIWGNKTPQNTENIDLLLDLFPDAYFLIVTRDVRDVCLSWKNKWGKDMNLVASKWAERMKKGWQATRKMDDEQFILVKFEDLLSTTEQCCRDICSFLDIPFSERMLAHNEFTPEKLDGKINYGQAIISENKEKWRRALTLHDTRRIEEIAYDTMRILDYRIEYADQNRPLSQFEKLTGVTNDVWATLFVGNRSSKKNSFSQRTRALVWEMKKRL